jgi:hypothetical protein
MMAASITRAANETPSSATMPPKRTATLRTASSGWAADAAGAGSIPIATALIASASLGLNGKGALPGYLTGIFQPPTSPVITGPNSSQLVPLNRSMCICLIGAKSFGPVLILMPASGPVPAEIETPVPRCAASNGTGVLCADRPERLATCTTVESRMRSRPSGNRINPHHAPRLAPMRGRNRQRGPAPTIPDQR